MQTYVAPKVPSLSSGLSTATLPFGSFPAQPSNPNQTSLFNQKPPAIVSVELSKPSSFASIPASSISDTIFKPAPKPTTEPILDKPPPFAASNIGNSFSTAIDPEKAKRDKEAEKQKEAMRKKKEEEERVQKQLEKDIEWGDHNDKFTRWSNWKMTNFKQ